MRAMNEKDNAKKNMGNKTELENQRDKTCSNLLFTAVQAEQVLKIKLSY